MLHDDRHRARQPEFFFLKRCWLAFEAVLTDYTTEKVWAICVSSHELPACCADSGFVMANGARRGQSCAMNLTECVCKHAANRSCSGAEREEFMEKFVGHHLND